MTRFTEFDVEQIALAWLEGVGWRVAHGPDIAPDMLAAERADYQGRDPGAVHDQRRARRVRRRGGTRRVRARA